MNFKVVGATDAMANNNKLSKHIKLEKSIQGYSCRRTLFSLELTKHAWKHQTGHQTYRG